MHRAVLVDSWFGVAELTLSLLAAPRTGKVANVIWGMLVDIRAAPLTCRHPWNLPQHGVALIGSHMIYEPIIYEPIIYEPIFEKRFIFMVLFMNRFCYSPLVEEPIIYEPIL